MDSMVRFAALAVLVQGCVLVPPQVPASPPPEPAADRQAQPPPVAQEEPPPPPHRHHHRHRPAAADADAAPVQDRDGDDDDETPPPERDRDPDDTGFTWPKAGSVDPLGMGTQYTAAQIKAIPVYERGRAYNKGDRVQISSSRQPNTRVFRCAYLARCTEEAPAGNGWQDDGWYDARAPRYVKYTPPPALKPGENPFPNFGKPIDEDELRGVPRFESGTTYSYGALVQAGYVTNPHYVVYRCTQKSCDHSPGVGNDWEPYGWYGRD